MTKFAVAIAVALLFAPPALAQMFSDEKMFNFGKHSGIATWAMRHCGAKPTKEFLAAADTGRRQNPKAFERGFNKGFGDGYDSEKHNGRENTCTTARMPTVLEV